MITKTIKHTANATSVISTEIRWRILGMTIVRKVLYYPNVKEYDVVVKF